MVSRTTPETGMVVLSLLSATTYLKSLWHIPISFAGLFLLGAAHPKLPICIINKKSEVQSPQKRVLWQEGCSNLCLTKASWKSRFWTSDFGLVPMARCLQTSNPAIKGGLTQALGERKIWQGTQVSLNGRTFPVAWSQWQIGTEPSNYRIGISDFGLMQTLGVELLNTKDATRQPVEWFSQSTTTTNNLTTRLSGQFRYLDITELALDYGWQMEIAEQTLRITSAPARVENIKTGQQPWGQRIVINVNRPTPWQLGQQGQEWVVTLDAAADHSILQSFHPPTSSTTFTLGRMSNQTTLRLKVPQGLSPRVSTIANPNRLVIDIRPDAMVERDILWSPGLRWRQQYVSREGSSRFPVVWLEINLSQPGLALKPIWSHPISLVGTAPLLKTALIWQASAAINGGFFNRQEQLPLGAIRRDGRWLSSPILNRGAIAWNDAGQVKIGRLSLEETLITQDGKRLPIVSFNSGYVQAGIARYTLEWGSTYTPLIDDEMLVVVQNNRVIAQRAGGAVGKTPFPIPSEGYLLVLRANSSVAGLLAAGTSLQIESVTVPEEFNRYPHILGAGPLLLQNHQIVLDAKAEKFSNAFIQETAFRSAIGTTASGNLIVATVQNRVGGRGPTLTEIAGLMQQLGAVDALNLDGGSSTTLYLGGQIINRPPSTAARVHNGLGIFLQPNP